MENSLENKSDELKLGLIGEELLIILIHILFAILAFTDKTLLIVISVPFAVPIVGFLIDILLLKTIKAAMGGGPESFNGTFGTYFTISDLDNINKKPFKIKIITAYISFLKKSAKAIIGFAILALIFWIASLFE